MIVLIRIVFAIMCISCLVVAWMSYKRNNENGRSAGMVMLFGACANLGYMLSICTDNYQLSSIFSSIEFISIDFVLVALFSFLVRFTGVRTSEKMERYGKDIIQLLVVLDVALLAVNPFLEVSISYDKMTFLGVTIFRYVPKTPFYYHLTLCYVLIVLTFVILGIKAHKTPAMYRQRYLSVLYSILLVVILNMVYLYIKDIVTLDYSILLYGVCGLMLYADIFYAPQGRILKEARNMLLENFGRAVALFDYENHLVYFNQEMVDIFPECVESNTEFFKQLVEEHKLPLQDETMNFEWRQFVGRRQHIYRCEYVCFRSEKHPEEIIGRSLVVMDTTFAKDPVTNLETTSGLYEYLFNHKFEQGKPIQIIAFNIVSLGVINKAFGYDNGNYIMMRLADQVQQAFGPDAYYAKSENGSIVAVVSGMSRQVADAKANLLCAEASVINELKIEYRIEYGIAECNRVSLDRIEALQDAYDSLGNKKLLNSSSQANSLIHSLQQTLLESDYETEAHAMRTKEQAVALATRLGLSGKEISQMALLAVLHDIGKIGIPQNILKKPSRLDTQEWEIMKSHCEKGYRIAKASKELMPIADYILHHHERWDGNGYPGKLKGEDIPMLSRIITVVDSFDVMTHDRPYHKHISYDEAIQELLRCSGTQFDPKVVEEYIKILEEEKGVLS